MAFSNGSYGKIWDFEDKGNRGIVNLSTSKKDKDTNQYETDFQHKFVAVVGSAYEFLKNNGVPENGLRVKIANCAVSNKYDPEKKVTYWNPVIFGLEAADGSSAAAPKSDKKTAAKKTTSKKPSSFVTEDDDDDSPLPF